MTDTFPRVRKHERGYAAEEVEEFLARAREAYAAPRSESGELGAERIRGTAFTIVKHGYSATHVDAALERLEDAFATRERERALGDDESAWYGDARGLAQIVLDRLDRPAGQRFARTSLFAQGYRRRDVDRFAHRISRYLQDGKPLSLEDVRTVTFRAQYGGYRERQVDFLLDSVVSVMLAVRAS